MQIVFLYGPAGAGKLTIGRELARLTGLPLFHNHFVVDAVGAVFDFGFESFIRLREAFWLQTFAEAAHAGREGEDEGAPEATVDPGFPARVQAAIEPFGGVVTFIALTVSPEEQERRIVQPSRAAFSKLQSVDLLRRLRAEFDASLAAMPPPALTIDTEACTPSQAAERIAAHLTGR